MTTCKNYKDLLNYLPYRILLGGRRSWAPYAAESGSESGTQVPIIIPIVTITIYVRYTITEKLSKHKKKQF